MPKIGLYARVSTPDQDLERQVDELRDYVDREHSNATTELYPDVVSGASFERGDEYERLWNDIEADDLDLVVIHEISRLSRLGAGAIHEFIEHCLEHETSVKDLEVGLELNLDDDLVDRAVSRMLAGIMGDLARIEHKQKLRRINSGIKTAQKAGKWTGRPPRGFTVGDDKRLHVATEEFLNTREALARIARGESRNSVANDTGIPVSTLSRLYDNKLNLYFEATAEDDRIDTALEEIRPIDGLAPAEAGELDARVRKIVQEELEANND